MKTSWLLALALVAGGCRPAEAPAPNAAPPSPSSSVAAGPVVLFLGTSLTAGLGIDPEHAFPALIQQQIEAAGLPHRIVNAGLSGETSAGARRRIGWLLAQPVDVLVLETGANDALRGQDPDATRANIQAVLDAVRAQATPPRVVLVGMQAPPNMGAAYARRFRALYTELARKNGVALVPFLLEGVDGRPNLNQPDGVHPTAQGHRKMAETVWSVLEPALRSAS